MSSRTVFCVVVAALLLFAATGVAKDPQSGRESLFSYGAGARALAMGGAFAAMADDASATYWNPAGLSLLEYRELSLMHVSLWEETSLDFVSAVWPILDIGTIGLSGARIGSKNIEFRDLYGPLGTHDYSTGQYWLSFGRTIYGPVHFGANLKVLTESIANLSTTTSSMDVALLFTPTKLLSMGVNLQDIVAGKLKLSRSEEEIPFNIKAGLAARWENSAGAFGASLVFDIDKIEGQPMSSHLGGEVMLARYVFARAGYDREYLTFGGGVRYRIASIDYAYKDHDVLGSTHRIGLSLFFGPTVTDQRKTRLERQNREQESLQTVQRIERTRALWDEAQAAFDRNQLDSAEVLCNQVLGFDSQHSGATELAARIRALKGQAAEEELDEVSAARARSEMVSRRIARGDTLLTAGRLLDARVEYEEALRIDSTNHTAGYGIVVVNGKIDSLVASLVADGDRKLAGRNYTDAIGSYNKALDLRGDMPEVRRKVERAKNLILLDQKLRDGVQAYNSGDTASARRLFGDALKIDGTNETALGYLKRIDEESTPVTTLEQLQSDPDYWELYVRGLTHFRNKEYKEAIDMWGRVLDKYPGSKETRANIEQARLRMGQ